MEFTFPLLDDMLERSAAIRPPPGCDSLSLHVFFTADPLGQHDPGQPVDTEAAVQRVGPPGHDLRPQ